ncbi:het-domain-containing protein [Fusarium flagelliforme]|uniref:Het-domain-containing protein n=2 Tax=Fusarium flagelliforme TaxID=2675880 RepID=A0A395M8K2_9HYPO|nr:het-domain-containing protein [Fusarium flagelliforme]
MDEVDVNKIFRLYKIKEDDSPPILKKDEKDPRSIKSLNIASGWLRDCMKNHDSCKPRSEYQRPPKRLINVGNETQEPFLVEVSPCSLQPEWVALSYCWGEEGEEQGKPPLKLTKNTLSKLSTGIALDELSFTIQDAILVTRALGIPYIWVDALCIIQQDDSRDWNEQASKMDEIYGGSTVTLVAASSSSAKYGFLKERRIQYIPVSRPPHLAGSLISTRAPAKVFLSAEWDKKKDELDGPWSKRGWTMQEGLLPRRLLYYTSSQMIWKCCEEESFERGVTKRLEDEMAKFSAHSHDVGFGSGWLWNWETFMKFKRFPDYIPSHLDYPLLSDPETFRLWYDLVEEYTQRKFTNIKDRLPAISGLAKIFGSTIRIQEYSKEYAARLWKADLIRGLLWHVEGAKLTTRPPSDKTQAIDTAIPSWSWASVGCTIVRNRHKDNTSFQALALVKDVQVDLVDKKHPFGLVKGGSVKISGPIKKLPRLYHEEWRSKDAAISELERHISEVIENESLGGVEHKYSSPPWGHFAALQMLDDMHSLDLLVLETTGDVINGINVYRRVGILTLQRLSEGDRASPDLIAGLKEIENSRTARLGPKEESTKLQMASKHIVMELGERWNPETVIII